MAVILRQLLCLVLLGLVGALRLQAQVVVRFVPVWEGKALELGHAVQTAHGPVTVTKLRFYLSNLTLRKGGHTVWAESNSYHLLDASNPSSLLLNLPIPSNLTFDSLTFNLGIDSSTNAKGAQAGVLDATQGMYWAWHSGYINLKLEGASPLCKTRKNQFQYHLGGFRVGENALQSVTLPARPGKENVVQVDAAQFLQGLDLAAEPVSMTPGMRNVELSRKAATMFTVQPKL